MRLILPTIYRFLATELARLLVVTTLVVVAVLAFALAVKPLAEGHLGAVEALRFMMYASVPMLQYALPFAAGFAATLVFHRMGSDNELTACYAGGVSHRRLLWPALAGGLILAAGMALLIDQAMPHLLRQMRVMISDDIAKIMQASIDRRQAFKIDDKRYIYADRMEQLPLDAASGADQHFVLTGVVAIELDPKGNIVWEASSRLAYVWLYRGGEESQGGSGAGGAPRGAPAVSVVLRLRDSIGVRRDRGMVEDAESTLVYQVPAGIVNDPKYLTWRELNQALALPEMMNWYEANRLRLAALLAERQAADAFRADLTARSQTRFTGGGRTVTVRAAAIDERPTAKGFAIRGGNGTGPEITVRFDDGRQRVHRPARAWLSLPQSADGGGGGGASVPDQTLAIKMEGVASGEADGGADVGPGGVLATYELTGLTPSPDPMPGLRVMTSWDLLATAKARLARPGPEDTILRAMVTRMEMQYDDLSREVLAKKHERIATVLACVVIVLCGAVMAMRLSSSLPLTVYLWSFLPSLAAILTISGGQTVAKGNGAIGLPVLYAGVAGLAGWTFMEYRKLVRH